MTPHPITIAREAKGIRSRRALARLVPCSPDTMNRFERWEYKNPGGYLMNRIAAVLQCPVATLFPDIAVNDSPFIPAKS